MLLRRSDVPQHSFRWREHCSEMLQMLHLRYCLVRRKIPQPTHDKRLRVASAPVGFGLLSLVCSPRSWPGGRLEISHANTSTPRLTVHVYSMLSCGCSLLTSSPSTCITMNRHPAMTLPPPIGRLAVPQGKRVCGVRDTFQTHRPGDQV